MPLTPPANLLVIQVGALARLDDVMGPHVVDSALAEMERRLPALFDAVLSRAETVRTLPAIRRGRWAAGFGLRDDGLAESAEDTLKVLEHAARHLLTELATEVFGAATAATACMAVCAAPVPAGATPCGAWLDERLASENGRHAEVKQLRADLRSILAQGAIRTLFQPIVDFDSGALLGFEALSRGPVGSPLERADHLFEAAARTGLTLDLERACAMQALSAAAHLPERLFLTVNTSAPLLHDAGLRAALARPGIVTEITEHLPLGRATEYLSLLADIRAKGGRVALDDTGCGFADTEAAEVLRPDIVKLCITVIRGARRDPSVLPEVAATIARFRALGAQVLAEGVETEDERQALSGMGIALAQGWLFGKPAPAASWRDSF